MVVVWLVESFQQGHMQLSAMISGIVPVRSFGSMSSLVRVITMESSMESGMVSGTSVFVVIDGRSVAEGSNFLTELRQTREVIHRQLGGTISFLMVCDSHLGAKIPQQIDVVEPSLLVAKVLELKRLSEQTSTSPTMHHLGHGDALFDVATRILRCRGCGARESLTAIESKILMVLMSRPEQTVERLELIRQVWGELSLSPRNIDAHMSRLRNRIGFTGLTVDAEYGRGYKLSIDSGCEAGSGRMAAPRGVSIRVNRPAWPGKQR